VAADQSFFEYGMTSLIGLKLSAQLGAWLGLAFEDVLVWNHGTLAALVKYASSMLASHIPLRPQPQTTDLRGVPDDEVARMLEAELALRDRATSDAQRDAALPAPMPD